MNLTCLTPREREVCILLVGRLTAKEIAFTLNVTLRTIRFHTTSIYRKLGVRDRVGLLVDYWRHYATGDYNPSN